AAHPLCARAAPECELEKRSTGKKDRCETLAPPQVLEDRGWWPRQHARPRAACGCCPNVRIPVLAAPAAISAATPEECHRSRREKACHDRPVRIARSSVSTRR